MKTRQDLFQVYRTEFGEYPSSAQYADWLEAKMLEILNMENIITGKPYQTSFERQMEALKTKREVWRP
jgi:hypothetical protein